MVQHTLNSVVREYLIEKGESNMNRFARMFQIAVSGLRELSYDTSAVPTAVLIPLKLLNTPVANQTQSQISSGAPQQTNQPNPSLNEGQFAEFNQIAQLPNNFVHLIRLAAIDGFGNLEALGEVGSIELPRFHNACGKEIQYVPFCNENINGNNASFGALGGTLFWNNLDGYADFYRNAEAVGRNFGAGGGNNIFGGYRIDLDRGTIILEGIPSGTRFLMLEYLADLSLVDDTYVVHPFILEALKTWMQYGDIRFNLRVGLGDKQMAKREFDLAEKQARRRFNNRNMQDWLQALRLSNKQAPKF